MSKMNVKLSKDRINTIIENVKTTMLVEGIQPSDETIEIGRRLLNGELTEDQAIRLVKEFVERENNKSQVR